MDGSVAGVITAVFNPAMSWDDPDWLTRLSPLPVLRKGILHLDEPGVPSMTGPAPSSSPTMGSPAQ